MEDQIFEGRAELNIKPFLDATERMERAAEAAAEKVMASLQQLDTGIAALFSSLKANGVSTAFSQIQKDATAAAAALKKSAQTAEAADKERATSGQRLYTALSAAQKAYEQAQKDGYARELALVRQQNADKLQAVKTSLAEELQLVKTATKDEAEAYVARYREAIAEIRAQMKAAQGTENSARGEQVQAGIGISKALTSGDSGALKAARQAYRDATQDIKLSIEDQRNAEEQLTAFLRAEKAAQARVVQETVQAEIEATRRADAEGRNGLAAKWNAFSDQLNAVEDRWNSVFRAGTQISSLGQQLTGFSQRVTQTGLALTENAGDFDFWARRLVAAAKSAGGAELDVELQQPLVTTENLTNKIMELGQTLGTLDPTQVAQSWFLYQAALGQSIQTTDDLKASQQALTYILRAAVVSDTDYGTAIRGVTQAMAEFGMGQEQAAYATSVMLNVTQTTQAEFSDVLNAFKMVGPQMKLLNMDLAESSALIARLSDYGLKGTTAGRGLQMAVSKLLDVTKSADKAMQYLFVTSQGLKGGWRDIIFEGGQFIGLLDKIDQQGTIVQEGFLRKFAEATQKMSEPMRQAYLEEIFPENAFRNLVPLVNEYVDLLNNSNGKLSSGKERMDELARQFRDLNLQAGLFNQQWDEVAQSVKVRLGQATFGLKEALIRLGLIAAEAFLPAVETLTSVIQKVVEWASANPELALTIFRVVGAIAAVAAVVGSLLIPLGFILQSIAGIAVAWTTLSGLGGVLSATFATVAGAASGLILPIMAVVAAVVLLGMAWRQNWLGLGDAISSVAGVVGQMLAALGETLGGFMTLLQGIFNGSGEQIRAGLEQIAVSIIEAFVVLPQQIGPILFSFAEQVYSWMSSTFTGLAQSMAVWGYNLMIALGEGIVAAASAVLEAVWSIAESIAMFFRSFSPPRHGPLKGIYVWGRNLIGSFVEGMNAADIGAVSDIAGRIGDALKLSASMGDLSIGGQQDAFLLANERAAEMVNILENGGQVTEEFFADLQNGLGEWYQDTVNILMAYQQLYGAERNLKVEQERLDLLKQQREELSKQAQLRADAFEQALGQSYTPSYENQQAAMVDPTTAEGQAKIAEMRRSLSTEDFQNWIGFQKQLWEQREKAEDQSLGVQEDAAQAAVDAAQAQVDAAKEQYDYYVQTYEYAKDLAETMRQLREQEEREAEERKKKEKEKLGPLIGSPEDLAANRDAVRGIVGDDQAIYDEGTLTERRGGDAIGAVTDAKQQREREESRLAALEAENRRRRAQLETALINAKSEEEQRALKKEMDAWDAAYKDEKARLQERIQLTKDIAEAAATAADRGEYGRGLDTEKRTQEEIAKIVGEQKQAILDAAAIKEQSKDTDEAQLKAKQQQQEEERKLKDLQAYGDQQRLEFARRIREAGNDPEAVRRIKDEQEAWNASYKDAVEAQQARVEAARRASQELANIARQEELDKAKKPKAGGAGGGFEPPDIPGGMGLDGTDLAAQLKDQIGGKGNPFLDIFGGPEKDEAIRDSKAKAQAIFDDFKRGLEFLKDPTISTTEKLDKLALAIAGLAPGGEEAYNGVKADATRGADWLMAGAPDWQSVLGGIWSDFTVAFSAGWRTYVAAPAVRLWGEFKTNLYNGWMAYVVQPALGLWAEFKTSLYNGWTTYVAQPAVGLWNSFWTSVQEGWNSYVVQPALGLWNSFWTSLQAGWNTYVVVPFLGLMQLLAPVFAFFAPLVSAIVGVAQAMWDFATMLSQLFGGFINATLGLFLSWFAGLNTIIGGVIEALAQVWLVITTTWWTIVGELATILGQIAAGMFDVWLAVLGFLGNIGLQIVEYVTRTFTEAFNFVVTALGWILDAVVNYFTTTYNNILTVLGWIWPGVKLILDAFVTGALLLFTSWRDTAILVLEGAKKGLEVFTAFLKDTFEGIVNDYTTWTTDIGNMWRQLASDISTWITGLADTVKTKVGEMAENAQTFFNELRTKVVEGFNSVLTAINNLTSPLRTFVDLLSRLRWPSPPSWLTGGGGGGGGNSGASAGGSAFVTNGRTKMEFGDNPGGQEFVFAWPLSGEGKTTLPEGATTFRNAVESVISMAQRAAADAAGAVAGNTQLERAARTPVAPAITDNRKSMEVNIDRVDAANPSEAKGLVDRLAFYGGFS